MRPNDTKRSAIDPPDHLVRRWCRWLKAGGFTGSLQEMEQAYLEFKGFDTWSDYLAQLGYEGHINEQTQMFWKDFERAFRQPPTRWERLVHYLAATSFGAWFIQKYLGMRGRLAA